MLVVVDRKPYFWGPMLFCSDEILGAQRSVETEGVAGSNIIRVAALCP